MRNTRHFQRHSFSRFGLCALVAALCCCRLSMADQAPSGLVRDMREALKRSEVGRAIPTDVAERLARGLRDVLARGDTAARLAAITAIGEMGVTVKEEGARAGFARQFGPDLARLVKDSDQAVRETAARALGKIDAEPDVAADALGALLNRRPGCERQAALAGLGSMVTVAVRIIKDAKTSEEEAAFRGRVLKVATAVVDTTSRGIHTSDGAHPLPRLGEGQGGGQLLKRRLEVIQLASGIFELHEVVRDEFQPEELARITEPGKLVEKEQAEFEPLARALGSRVPVLARTLGEAPLPVRLLTAQIFLDMGSGRLRLYQRRKSTGPDFTAVKHPAEEALTEGLKKAFPALRSGLRDPDVRIRLAVLETFETLEAESAAAVAPAAAQALADPDRFVRWAAARTLQKIGTGKEPGAIAGLTALLRDPDPDITRVAAAALGEFGTAAAVAVPALSEAVGRGDVVAREAVIHALEAIGTNVKPALPALTAALEHPDGRVRKAAASALGSFGPAARQAVPALRDALEDPDPEVRKAASEALLGILPTK